MVKNTTRIHILAKELGVKSKAIVEKCRSEGFDIKNHMSTVPVSLAKEIRKWFTKNEHDSISETTKSENLDGLNKQHHNEFEFKESKDSPGISWDRSNLEEMINNARDAYKLSDFSKAIEYCDEILAIDPNLIKIMNFKGAALNRLGDYNEAIKQYDRIIAKDPNNTKALQGKGIALLNKKDYEAAINTFNLLVKLDPDNNIAWHSMGEAYFKLNSFDHAIKSLDKSININPHNESSWVYKAKALSKKGLNDEAADCLDQALGYAKNKSHILREKGIVYKSAKNRKAQFECYDKAIELNPKCFHTYLQKAGDLQQERKYEEAIECFKEAIDNDFDTEKEALLWHNLATAYLLKKDFQNAINSINKSLELNDNDFTRQVKDSIENTISFEKKSEQKNKTDASKKGLSYSIGTPKLFNIPKLPVNYKENQANIKNLKSILLDDKRDLAIIGRNGIGKTVNAIALANDKEIQKSFPDGIFWVDCGSKVDIREKQRDISKAFEYLPVLPNTVEDGRDILSNLLAKKSCLIILDDPLKSEYATAFKGLGSNVRLIITTQPPIQTHIVNKTGALGYSPSPFFETEDKEGEVKNEEKNFGLEDSNGGVNAEKQKLDSASSRVNVTAKVYVSYSFADAEFCDWLANILRNVGHKVYYFRGLESDVDYQNKHKEYVANANVFIPLVSAKSIDNHNVNSDIGAVLDNFMRREGVFIMPLVLDNVVVPYFLQNFSAMKMPRERSESSKNHFLEVFERSIETKLKKNVQTSLKEEDILIQDDNIPKMDVGAAEHGVSDLSTAEDSLGFAPYVKAVADFLIHENTKPPFVLSVEGEWGSGKSSFMEMLKEQIQEVSEDNNLSAFLVEFDPWRHDKDEAVWAAFVLVLIDQLGKKKDRVHFWRRCGQLQTLELKYLTTFFSDFKLRYLYTLNIKKLWRIGRKLRRILYRSALFDIKKIAYLIKPSTWYNFARSPQVALHWSRASLSNGWLVGLVRCILHFLGLSASSFKKGLQQISNSPNYKGHVGFIDTFHQDFVKIIRAYAGNKRVFVFIDDLDRCAVPKAAELMESINKMISDNSNLVFIMGMDREKVAAGLAVKHEKLLPYLSGYAEKIDGKGIDTKDSDKDDECRLRGIRYGYSFLEKFIQVPFYLPQPNENAIKKLLLSLPGQAQEKNETDISDVKAPSSYEKEVSGFSDISKQTPTYPEDQQSDPAVIEFEEHQRQMDKIEGDTEKFREMAIMIAPALGNNPRRVKQFVNLLRLQFRIAITTNLLKVDGGPGDVTFEQLGKFVGIGLGWPLLMREIENYPELLKKLANKAEGDLYAIEPPYKKWSDDEKLTELLKAGDGENYSLKSVNIAKLLEVT